MDLIIIIHDQIHVTLVPLLSAGVETLNLLAWVDKPACICSLLFDFISILNLWENGCGTWKCLSFAAGTRALPGEVLRGYFWDTVVV